MFRLLLILSVFLGVHSIAYGPKCKLDRACVTKQSIEIYQSIFLSENNQLDPMYLELIKGDFGVLKYSLTDTIIDGFKKCSVVNANLDLENLKCEAEFYCPEFHISGKYDVHGNLFGLPVDGTGEFTMDSGAYDLKIRMDVSVTPKGDKQYLHIDNLMTDSTALEDLVYNATNLFNGQKELADNFLKFVNENSKAVAKEMQEPLFRASFKKIIQFSNKFLKEEPLENLFAL